MGFGGISIWQLLIILAIIILIFGTKKLRNIGGDLGGAVKNFKKAMADETNENQPQQTAERLEKVEENQDNIEESKAQTKQTSSE